MNYEMFFYLVVAIGLGLRVRIAPFVAVVLLLLSLIGFRFSGHLPVPLSFVDPLLLEFLYGVLLAEFAVRLKARGVGQKIFYVVAMVAALTVIERSADENVLLSRALVWGLSSLVLVGAAVGLESDVRRLVPRWLLAVGNSSYSLYLTHTIVLAGIRVVLDHYRSVDRYGVVAEWILCVVTCILVGELTYRWVEQPLMHALRDRKPRVVLVAG